MSPGMSDPSLEVRHLGLVAYEEARRLQAGLVEDRLAGRVPDTLLLLEHPPVITRGRGTGPHNLLPGAGELPVVESERGGDVTLHAPGQVVGYFIRLLPDGARDLHAHMRLLEEIQIRTLAEFGVRGARVPQRTGVWTRGRKIASIGVACRRWCTWHGFALNVSTDLALFRAINPCGLAASVMTSIMRETGTDPGVDRVKRVLAREAPGALAAPVH